MAIATDSYHQGWEAAVRSEREIVDASLSDMAKDIPSKAEGSPELFGALSLTWNALLGLAMVTIGVGVVLGVLGMPAGFDLLTPVLVAVGGLLGLHGIYASSKEAVASEGGRIQPLVDRSAMSLQAGLNADQMALLQSSPHSEFKALGRAIAQAWPAASEDGRRRLQAVYLDPASRMAGLLGDRSGALPAEEAATIAEATRRVEATAVMSRTGATSVIAKVMRDRMAEV